MLQSFNSPALREGKTRKLHNCAHVLPEDGYGAAIEDCVEHDDGSFWAGNGEYGSQVNYCPFCGKISTKRVVPEVNT